jgi:pimeloyl-ACP methyl ester carboxylesterase
MSKISPAKGPKPGRQKGQPADPAFAVSARWLASAIGLVLAGAAVCVWATLCLTFWQGSWQLLYHPSAAIRRTPAAVGVPFDKIAFATSESGIPRLEGWWCGSGRSHTFTAIYLHGAEGNLGAAIGPIAHLHAAGFDVLAFDYRGYGQSQFAHPSEAHWKEDTESALHYLTETRHIAARSIVFAGDQLGADLALEIAADHPETAGVILEFPIADPTRAIFEDPRAHLVPAHWLMRDRWDLEAAAVRLKVPSLWLCRSNNCAGSGGDRAAAAVAEAASPKWIVAVAADSAREADAIVDALSRWRAGLAERH